MIFPTKWILGMGRKRKRSQFNGYHDDLNRVHAGDLFCSFDRANRNSGQGDADHDSKDVSSGERG